MESVRFSKDDKSDSKDIRIVKRFLSQIYTHLNFRVSKKSWKKMYHGVHKK